MGDRPTFEYQGQPVRAAGILVYTFHHGSRFLLFRRVNGKLEDIGGKTDPQDHSIFHTAAREGCEETNGKLFSKHHTRAVCFRILLDLLQNTGEPEYNKRCKYLLFKIWVSPRILKESMTRFGLEEKTDRGTLQHYYRWHQRLPTYPQLHFRLKGLQL
jgi:hypothetical protein